MSVTLTDQDRATLRTAAFGAVSLLAAASRSPHRVATDGSIALHSATGLVGHVLGAKQHDVTLRGATVAELADQVLPALTESVRLLERQAPTEALQFRRTVLVAIDAGRARLRDTSPVVAEMIRTISAALDAA